MRGSVELHERLIIFQTGRDSRPRNKMQNRFQRFFAFWGVGVAKPLDNPSEEYNYFVHYVYLLYSHKDHNFYTGYTSDLKRRIKEHLNGEELSTKNRQPLELVYYEAYLLKQDAEAREKYLKTSMGRRVISKQLAHYLMGMEQMK